MCKGPKASDWQKDRVSMNVVVLPVSPCKSYCLRRWRKCRNRKPLGGVGCWQSESTDGPICAWNFKLTICLCIRSSVYQCILSVIICSHCRTFNFQTSFDEVMFVST